MLVVILFLGIIETILIIRLIFYLRIKVKSLTGIEQDCYVRLNGRKQYLLIRGENINNPIILFLHNSPGCSQSYLMYYFHKYIKDRYTLVYWDQTGGGKSYIPKEEPITYKMLEEDLHYVVEYLCNRFHKEKLILMGHSCGTYLGARYIKRNPDRIEAFISINQLIHTREAVITTTERVMNMYEKKERKSAHAIFQLLKTVEDKKEMTAQSVKLYWSLKNRLTAKLCPNRFFLRSKRILMTLISPDLKLLDIRWMFFIGFHLTRYIRIYKTIVNEVARADIVKELGYDYKVPFYIIYGDRDYMTSPDMISEFYSHLSAPRKNLVEIINSGNKPHLENPKTFTKSIESILNELHNNR